VSGVASTFFLFVVLGAIAMAFVYYCVPETKGRSLEQIEAYFLARFAKEAN
jgi:major inositol transporter-like SP family MFS transporter